MEEKSKGDPYTMDFISRKGGPETVAKRTGMNRQTVRQVASGRNAPGFDFIKKMVAVYADYDLRVGVTQGKAMATAGEAEEAFNDYTDVGEEKESLQPSISNQVLAAENAGLRKEIARLEETVSILRTVVSSQLGKDIESVKTESISDTTQGWQLPLVFDCVPAEKRSMIKLPMDDLRPLTRTWPNPMRHSPKR
ncbi:hypothetical protein [Spirosoma sp.]|uniref:helix-turn-helix domain-containing protein n=1 Tax=Spirosoma sp. TaxID=1899569 RepID=UPI00261750BA|nr:hypothetical protein [Spirosoma sp.]MCX6218308.1 hypothetical protein [Spirosoma sp.]